MEEAMNYAFSQGPWAVIAIAGLLGVWRGAKWVGLDIIKPIAQRHLAFVDQAAKVLDDIADSLRAVNDQLMALRQQHFEQCNSCPRKPKGPEELDTDRISY